MRTAVTTLMLAMLLPAGAVFAHDHHVNIGSCEVREPLEWGARHDLARARFAILTEDQAVTLILTQDLVVVQLSDRTFHKLDREIE